MSAASSRFARIAPVFLALLADLPLLACYPKPRALPLDLSDGDTVIVVTADPKGTILGTGAYVYAQGADLGFTAQADSQIYVWTLAKDGLVHPDGRPLSPAEIVGVVEARPVGTGATRASLDGGSGPGSCGRCLVPTLTAPQIVNDGDLCTIPAFADGALYLASGDAYTKMTNDESKALTTKVRASIELAWPKSCACAPENGTAALAKLDIVPIAPADRPHPLRAFAEDPDDPTIIAGFGQGAAALFDVSDPANPKSTVSTYSELDADITAAAGLRGGDFLVAAEGFNLRYSEGSSLLRVGLESDGPGGRRLSKPLMVRTTDKVHVAHVRYLRGPGNAPYPPLPIYVIGYSFELGVNAPRMLACDESMLDCRQVPVTQCTHTPVQTSLHSDLQIMPDGSGVGIAYKGIFLKAPSRTSSVNPSADDVWNCNEPIPYPALNGGPGSESTEVSNFEALGSAGNRAFVCARSAATSQCAGTSAVVLTSTIANGEASWRVLMRAPDKVYCHRFLKVRGHEDRVRLVFGTGEYVDFDASGATVGNGQIGSALPARSPGWFEVSSLPSSATLMRAFENAVYWSDGGGGRFNLIYGTSTGEFADYRGIVSTEDGFYAFGNPQHLVEVVFKDPAGGGPHPDPKICTVPWNGFMQPGDHVLAAVRDTSRTDQYAVLVAGYNDANGTVPLLRRAFIARGQPTGDSDCTSKVGDLKANGAPSLDVQLTSPMLGTKLTGLTEIGPGHFLATTNDTRLVEIDENDGAELPIDWDVPSTPAVETMPTSDADPCTHSTPPLDAWRSIDGGHGVAWVVGDRGLIFRVSGKKTQRFIATVLDAQMMKSEAKASWSSVRSACPDRVLVGGQYVLGDLEYYQAGVWEIAHDGSQMTCTPFDLQRGASDVLVVRAMDESCTAFADAPQLVYDWPASFFADAENVWVGFSDGYIHRFHADNSKVPFGFSTSVQNPKGYVLFGAPESRLAVGFPAGQAR